MNSKQRRQLTRQFKAEIESRRAAARLIGRRADLDFNTNYGPYHEHLNALQLRTEKSLSGFVDAQAAFEAAADQAVCAPGAVAQVLGIDADRF
ncbi:MAG: hypothetical protein JSS14_22180 [Proteobacteria bacterium]|nr:hypothetical protein [Pseudomonadota bacterium]